MQKTRRELFHPAAEGVFCFDDAANKPTKLLHDCRRSAVRNMVLDTVRGGTSEKVCMAISGHKTRSIFDRYDIVSEKDLMASAKRLSDHVNKAAEKLSRERQSHENHTRKLGGRAAFCSNMRFYWCPGWELNPHTREDNGF